MAMWNRAGRPKAGDVYTRFVAELAADGDPGPALVEPLLAKLRDDLVRELRRRSLWGARPAYLGVHGHTSWLDPASDRGSQALDELLFEAFTALFVERLPTLRTYLATGSPIDALVPLMLRQFIHDAQVRHDRLGVRLFRLLRAAVRQAAQEGDLEIAGGDARVTSDTLLRAGDEGSLGLESRDRLVELVSGWNDELLCDLVAAPSRQVPAVVTRLRQLVGGLAAAGVPVFRFGELVAAVRSDVRRRWTALFATEQGEPAWEDAEAPGGWLQLCQAVEPEAEQLVLAQDSFRHLIDCVARHIEAMPAPESTRGQLYRLWGFLYAFATDEAPAVPGEREDRERLPSRRKLARFLGLPRDRFAELLSTLAGFLTHCRSSSALEGGIS